jgi:hypothetical protein
MVEGLAREIGGGKKRLRAGFDHASAAPRRNHANAPVLIDSTLPVIVSDTQR